MFPDGVSLLPRRDREDMDSAELIDPRSVSVLDERSWRAWRQNNRRRDERAAVKRILVVKGSCIAALLAASFLAIRTTDFGILPAAIVTLGAGVVAQQAFSAGRYNFAVLFALTLLIFNPLFPLLNFAGAPARWAAVIAAAAFASSLLWLNPGRRFTT